MRILFLSHKFYPDVGGIEVNSEILATQFQQMGHSVTLVTWTPDRGDRDFSFKVVRNPGISQLFALHRKVNVVFENNPCLRLAWPSLFFGSTSVIALRTWVARNDGEIAWQDRLKINWIKKADAVIAVSKAVADSGPNETQVIGNPYRNKLFRSTQRNRENLSFAFLGRLVSSKGCEIALEAFAILFEKQKKEGLRLPTLKIIGDGELRNQLEMQANEFGIGGAVTFTGFLQGEELVAELNKNAYLLVPSLIIEAFGNVALEGMACGCLPIVSETGGLPDAVGEAGVVVKNPDAENFYNAISHILKNPQREKELRERASEHLLNHTPQVVAEKYMAVILNAIK